MRECGESEKAKTRKKANVSSREMMSVHRCTAFEKALPNLARFSTRTV